MTERTARPPRTTGEPPPLIFEWRRERGVRRRLAMWLLVVAAGYAALFYLFRVAPPTASRKPPAQHAVLFLPPAESGVRSLLGTLEDRYPGAVLRSEDFQLKADMAALAKVTPPSEPSWATHRPALRPFPQPLVPQELPAFLQPGDVVLPEIGEAPPMTAPAPAPVRPAPALIIDDSPQGRSIARPPAWPENLIDETWPQSASVPFTLGVNRSGNPEFCLPASPGSGIDLEALRGPLMATRFNPVPSGGLQWIKVVVRW
jgi:hypothetical protein